MNAQKKSALNEIPPNKIKPNKDNPRLIFREKEMNQLLESIKEVGIKVPITVYQDSNRYVLIDGERRWRCARKLNLDSMPAIIQPKPSRLENLLMMFNIHNVRVDWDLMPMALKLKEVKEMLEKVGQECSPAKLAGITGLSKSTVNRALELLELPSKYRRMLLREAEKPKSEQSVTADLFVEINKSYAVMEKYTPEICTSTSRLKYIDIMVDKYLRGIIKNVVHLRIISKIARVKRAGKSKSTALPILKRMLADKDYTIEEAFTVSVQSAYKIRDINTRVIKLIEELSSLKARENISIELRSNLERLHEAIMKFLGDN